MFIRYRLYILKISGFFYNRYKSYIRLLYRVIYVFFIRNHIWPIKDSLNLNFKLMVGSYANPVELVLRMSLGDNI